MLFGKDIHIEESEPVLPTKLPTEMKNELMLELTDEKYDWEGLVNSPNNPTAEEKLLLMNAGVEGRDLLLLYKRKVCKTIAEVALKPVTHSFAIKLMKNKVTNSRLKEEIDDDEYASVMSAIKQCKPEEEKFWEKYVIKNLRKRLMNWKKL